MNKCRQRPTLPHSFPCSTIGGIRLNFRVRNGNGCDPDPMTTGKLVCLGSLLRPLRGLRRGKPVTNRFATAVRDLSRRSLQGVGGRRIVPDNLCQRARDISDFRRQMSDWCANLKSEVRSLKSHVCETPEYSANGSLTEHTHAAVSACMKQNLWSSLTAD